jgi:hypothetical protein
MKLSDAIREGAKLRPQAFGAYQDALGGSCALGAAYEAFALRDNAAYGVACAEPFFRERRNPWGTLLRTLRDTPCPDCGYMHYEDQITHLNDTHKWTRERIADWVATQEPANDTE